MKLSVRGMIIIRNNMKIQIIYYPTLKLAMASINKRTIVITVMKTKRLHINLMRPTYKSS